MRKKKQQPVSLSVAEMPELSALMAAGAGPKAHRGKKCHVCGGEVAAFTTEDLCWVCRRLKISAWRENDAQAGVQE